MSEKGIVSVNSSYEFSPQKLDQYPDLTICIEYLILKDSALTMDQITAQLHQKYPTMPGTRVGLYGRIAAWRADGTLKEAEIYYIEPKLEEMRSAIQYVIMKFPEGLRVMADDITNPNISLKTRTETMAFLKEAIVDARLSQEEQPGTVERRYADKKQNFSPTDL